MRSPLPWRQALAALLLALAGVSALAGTTASFTFRAKDYPGSRDREYKVYRPDNLDGAAPMLMALHGCRQTEDEVLRDWGLTAAADRFGFILHHNLDKVLLVGGAARPAFGGGVIDAPIEVMIAGRATHDYTLNSLDLRSNEELARGKNYHRRDLFYRFNQTFQDYFDMSAKMETTYAI